MTEFCTYGSLFDFLHSMDWMVTDDRMSMLSASVQSWATDRQSTTSAAAQANGTTAHNSNSIGTNATVSPPLSQSGPDGQTAVVSSPLSLNVPGLAPMVQSTDTSTWPVFTQLVTPPPSPAPSPAILHSNVKRNSLGGAVQNLFMRPAAVDRSKDRGAELLDLEKGGNELSGMGSSSGSVGGGGLGVAVPTNAAASGGGSGSKLSSNSESKNSSNADVAARLADAVSAHFQPAAESQVDSQTEQNTHRNSNRARAWSNSSSYAGVSAF